MSDFWKNKRVLVTGGTGFIGTHLCRELNRLGAVIGVLVHKTPYGANGYSVQMLGDLTNEKSGWDRLITMFSPSIVFHLAAQPIVGYAASNSFETIQTNVRGTYNLLDVCKDIKSIDSFVHISTDKVYGNVSPIKDDTIPSGTEHPYNTSKLASDVLAQMYSSFYNIPMVVIRNANVYGSGDYHFDRLIPNVIKRVLSSQNPIIRGTGENTRDFIYVGDIVQGYLDAARIPYLSQKNLTVLNLSGHNHSIIDVVDRILFKLNRVDLAPVFEGLWSGEIPHQNIVNGKAKDLIGWNPKTNLDQGLDMTIPWYKEN